MHDTCARDAPHATPRARLRNGGYVTIGTLIVAAASALLLVLTSGCHSAPATQAFAATQGENAIETRLRQAQTMPPLRPFDEHFVDAGDAPTR